MKAVKNVLSWAFVIALIAMIFSPPQARADGMPGVRETAKEVLVEVPKFCRPLRVMWEVVWERNEDNKDLMVSFIKRDEKKLRVLSYQRGAYRVETIWRGGEVVHIPKFDSKGHPIQVQVLSILAFGDDDRAFDTNNWRYESQNSRWVNGATVSPLVHNGFWGVCT